jgi:hypothetical protein
MLRMTTKYIFRNRRIQCALLGAILGTLTACVVQPVDSSGYVAPAPVQVETTVGVEGGLVYYPNYEVYYDPSARAYWYNRGGNWVNGSAPAGISVDVLVHSPSVRMNFRDSPANHHGEVIRQYPRDWQPPGRDRR